MPARYEPNAITVTDLLLGPRLRIPRLEWKWKISQNWPIEDRLGVTDGLQAGGKSEIAAPVGAAIGAAGGR